jgi:hypothetical protein
MSGERPSEDWREEWRRCIMYPDKCGERWYWQREYQLGSDAGRARGHTAINRRRWSRIAR